MSAALWDEWLRLFDEEPLARRERFPVRPRPFGSPSLAALVAGRKLRLQAQGIASLRPAEDGALSADRAPFHTGGVSPSDSPCASAPPRKETTP